MVAGNPHDTDLYTWWLAWNAHAVSVGHFSLITHAMNAPTGVNAMWNTSLLLPGVVLSPITLVAGAQVSYNVLLFAGLAGSAYTAHRLLLRYAGVRWWPALVGGALYGFSPAMVHASTGHVSLVFAPLVPLLIAATLDVCTGRVQPVIGGLRLGALASAQLLTGEELLFDTALVTGVLLVCVAIFRPAAAGRAVRSLGLAIWAATALALTLVGYPLWIQLYGPLAQHGSPLLRDYTKIDLAEFVTPSQMMLLHTHHSAATALAIGPLREEYLGYLGWPLLVCIALAAVLLWRNLPARVAAITAAATMTFSLGEHLKFHGHQTHVPMPWLLVRHLPLAADVAVSRFALFTPLAVGAVLAIAYPTAEASSGSHFRRGRGLDAAVPRPFQTANVDHGAALVGRGDDGPAAGHHRLWCCRSPMPTSPIRCGGRPTPVFGLRCLAGTSLGRPGMAAATSAAMSRVPRLPSCGKSQTALTRRRSPRGAPDLETDFAFWHVGALLLGPGRGDASLCAL